MRRVRIPLRSIADTFCKSKSREHGRRNVTGRLELCRTVATINGHVCLGYGEESRTKTLQLQIVDALRLGERSRASSLLSDLGDGNQPLKADDFVYILNYCAKSPDPLFFMETWRLIEQKEIGLNNKCCLLMVQALCRGGYLEEACNLIKFLGENRGIYPFLSVYNSFLGACAKMQTAVHANQCLDLMERQRVGKNEITYSELLKLAVWQQNLSAVHEIWKDYIKHYSLNIISLRKFIWSFTRLKDLKSAYETLQHMVALAISGKIFVSRTGEGRLYSSRLDIPIPSKGESGSQKVELGENEQDFALKFDTDTSNVEICKSLRATVGILNNYKSMPVMKVLRWSFSDVIHACAQARDYKLAEHLMVQMQNLGLQPSSHTYDGFMRAVLPTRGFSAGMEMLKVMEERNMKPYASTLAALSVQCSKALELDLAEALLDQVCECPHPYPYNAFFGACDTMPERAIRLLAKMRQRKLQPDIRTYELLFSLFGNVNAPYEEGDMLSQVDSTKRIKAIEMDMAKNGVQHSHLSMKNLLKALGAEGMTRELLHYLHIAEKLFCHTNTYMGAPIYNTVLHSLIEAAESQMAIEIFKNMKSCGLQPCAATYNIMIDCCSTMRCFKSACALVSMMVRNGFYPETMTYTSLIKILLEYENFDEAINLLDQASLEGHQLDVILYNTILFKASEKGRIDIMEFTLGQMHQHKVQPDPSTCYYVFSAYVDRGFHNTAMEALQVLSMWMISDEDSTLEEKKGQFEDNFVLSEDLEAESRILQVFKDSEEHLAIALLNLRWCAILGFPVSWSPNQSGWVSRLKTNYDRAGSTVL
ncbi:pentatricopeptide repeat-containing protein At1g76280 isoform X2 [Herrania umbratica]|uniref:Pentatricopeptide repeat-containing protein At1g76280 isoform X2 n=1 Tax=Herrania umbratica TaxID=108875 RepID=A0A6J1AC32_9ROSI|nr:pentatricopeptide repeat-containing protein At1g76280 isoform X2 [Herrania umbratica]